MLEISELKSYYSTKLQSHPRFILREYLQYKILEIIYSLKISNNLVFLGGTCLRLVYGNKRFSEDLDFDNFNLSQKQFTEMRDKITYQLEREGYKIDTRVVLRAAWHCYIKFPKLLYELGLSDHPNETLLIQIDTEPHHFKYDPNRKILNKLDIFTTVLTVPLSIVLSQKIYAVLNRPRSKGRDFFDIVFLLGKNVLPNFDYLKEKVSISNMAELKKNILEKCDEIDMNIMAEDVEPFLFEQKDKKRVLQFENYIKQEF
ncbi:MAG: nucleotidyl transferase AbiEii/AbiGii toxin family protein [Candidatus Cloacimonetes bacterium]|nr:nucleotidyl transferase AbiEii/AbiGii toxin family protein [Candidatus Cloacimonadota bacterium]